jgi:hypothetical protein
MARLTNGIFGPFTGKIGGVVGSSWRGMPILKTAPKETTKKPSPAQLLQRAKFSFAMAFLYPIKPFLAERFGKIEGSKSPFDLALSYHLKETILVEGDMLLMNYPKVCISKGHLRGLEVISATINPETTLTLQWTNNSNQSFASPGDMLTVALYVPSNAAFFFFENCALRQDTVVQLTLPEEAANTEIHSWGTFVSFTGSRAATSTYFLVDKDS